MPFPDYPPTLPQALRHCTREFAPREMVVLGEERYTYAEVERESAYLAKGLRAAGAGKGTRIGILMPNTPAWVLLFLAITRIGALAVPLSTLYRPRELATIIPFADIEMLLVVDRYGHNDYVRILEEALPGLTEQARGQLTLAAAPYLRSIVMWGASEPSWAQSGPDYLHGRADLNPQMDDSYLRALEDSVTPADLMLMIYTSGSTAAPKGVVHTHGGVIRHTHILAEHFGFEPGDRFLTQMPFFWLGGLNFSLFPAMYSGVTLCCARTNDPGDLIDVLLEERCSHLAGWPQQTERVKRHPKYAGQDFSFMKPNSPAMPGGLHPPVDDSGNPLPRNRISSALGMTETFGPHSRGRRNELVPPGKEGTAGLPMAGIDRKIVDPDSGAEQPPGQPGELLVRGYSLMAGYYKKEREETFERDGFFRTGDVCSIDEDGYLFFHGRLGEMVKTMGANVAPREVELVLESFAEVQEAGVLGVPDDELGERLVAVVVPAEGENPNEEVLRIRLKNELSSYKVPRQIIVCALEDLPRTGSNKLDKTAVRRLLSDGSLPGGRGGAT